MRKTTKKNNNQKSQKIWTIISLSTLAVIFILFAASNIDSGFDEIEIFAAQKGDFIISVSVKGELEAAESRIVSAPSNIRENLQILYLVPEGSIVEEGDMLIQFDISELENKLNQELNDLEVRIIDRDELITQQAIDLEIREMQLEVQRFQHQIFLLQLQRMDFEPEMKRRQLEIDMIKAELQTQKAVKDLDDFKRKCTADLKRREDRIAWQQEDVDEVRDQIESARVLAPIGGLVIYKTMQESGRKRKIKVGDTVHRRQEIVELPDLSTIVVDLEINETEFVNIRRGQEVIITVDALDSTYYGTLTDISRLAHSVGTSKNVKVFDGKVTIENSDNNLRPGMAASCRIITDKIHDVVFVPKQAVFEDNGSSYVYHAPDFEKKNVVTGPENKDFIVITEGLEPGDMVALRNPSVKLEVIGRIDEGTNSINKGFIK